MKAIRSGWEAQSVRSYPHPGAEELRREILLPIASNRSALRSAAVGAGLLLTAMGWMGWMALPVRADQVLQVHANSLTSYRSTSKSAVQDVRPQYEQRAVNLDGTLRLGSSFPLMIAGNPSGEGWNGQARLGDIRLDTGTYVTTAVDLALPAKGFSWVIARSYNCRQVDSTPAYFASDGYQGKNWFQMSQPEIVLYQDGQGNAEDIVYMILGADRFIELKRKATDSDYFQAVNGAAG